MSYFGGFQSPEVRAKKKKVRIARPESFMWFSLCSQTYRRMIKDLYFISGL
jgi:hypothetical protein